MAKRFYDTLRIEEGWYLELSCKHRELLRYCESKCDGAGIFSWNSKIASTYIGEKITDLDLEKIPVSKLPNGKYFVIGFCMFQNGKLSEKSPAHNSVFKSIAANEITESVLFSRVFDRLQSSQEEREIEKEVEKEKEQETPEQKLKKRESEFTETIRPFLSQYPRDMLLAFFNYWTEPNPSKTKMKFELQPTWDIGRRLKTWADNQKNFKKPENDRVKNSNELDELLRESIANLSADNG